MPQKKKKGVDDQQRIAVQNRTLTNWINDKLTDHKIDNLAKELDDGLVLIELLQNLSGKIVPERWVNLIVCQQPLYLRRICGLIDSCVY